MENRLENLPQFEQILENYKISKTSQEVLEKTRLLLLLAPSASGRNTIIKELLKTGDYHFVISDTTRQPRVNDGVMEQNGVEYWFRTEDEMLSAIKNGEMIEAEVIHGQHVSGMSIREIQKASEQNKIALTDIDYGGAAIVRKAKPDTAVVLLVSPDFNEWMRRLGGRGSLPAAEVKRRMQTAEHILESAHKHVATHVVVNDEVHKAAEVIHAIKFGQKAEPDPGSLAVVDELLAQTRRWLAEH